MGKIIKLLIFCFTIMSLTGCGYLTGRTEEMINDYNIRLEKTLINYENLKEYAEENKAELISFITNETDSFKGFSSIEDLNKVYITSTSHILSEDIYFTSMDATALREILIFVGEQTVYVEVIWNVEGVISITRRVI